MIPLALASVGIVTLAAGALLLRRLGTRYRVARLLAAAPEVSLAEADALAGNGAPAYVRVGGRVTSAEEFPDENDRPLVYRRTRLQALVGGEWRTLTDNREAVPFGLERRGRYVAVDADALADGLVVMPRESVGRAADLPADLAAELASDLATLAPDGTPDATRVRLLVEQVSAVEHAVAAGVLSRAGDGTAVIRPGLGRPLILTTLELPAAMRVLAAGGRPTVLLATALLVLGLAFLAAAIVAAVAFG